MDMRRIDPDAYDPEAAQRIVELYSRTRLAALAGSPRDGVEPAAGCLWGNASPEMLTGGLSVSLAMEDI